MTSRRATHQPVQTGGPSARPGRRHVQILRTAHPIRPHPGAWFVTTPWLGHDDYFCEANTSPRLVDE